MQIENQHKKWVKENNNGILFGKEDEWKNTSSTYWIPLRYDPLIWEQAKSDGKQNTQKNKNKGKSTKTNFRSAYP